MAQFDVHQFVSRAAPLVVEVQSNVLEDLASRVVVPLVPALKAGSEEVRPLKPRIVVNGTDYILMTTDLGALPRARLGPVVANIEIEHRGDITNALDFLILGF